MTPSGVRDASSEGPSKVHSKWTTSGPRTLSGSYSIGRKWRRGRDSHTEGQVRGCSVGDQREPTLGPRERSPVFKTSDLLQLTTHHNT